MLGLDTSKPLNEQVINNDTGLTWADDFLNTAKDNARSAYALADAAEAAGFTLSGDDLGDIDSTINNMKQIPTSILGFQIIISIKHSNSMEAI